MAEKWLKHGPWWHHQQNHARYNLMCWQRSGKHWKSDYSDAPYRCPYNFLCISRCYVLYSIPSTEWILILHSFTISLKLSAHIPVKKILLQCPGNACINCYPLTAIFSGTSDFLNCTPTRYCLPSMHVLDTTIPPPTSLESMSSLDKIELRMDWYVHFCMHQ